MIAVRSVEDLFQIAGSDKHQEHFMINSNSLIML